MAMAMAMMLPPANYLTGRDRGEYNADKSIN